MSSESKNDSTTPLNVNEVDSKDIQVDEPTAQDTGNTNEESNGKPGGVGDESKSLEENTKNSAPAEEDEDDGSDWGSDDDSEDVEEDAEEPAANNGQFLRKGRPTNGTSSARTTGPKKK